MFPLGLNVICIRICRSIRFNQTLYTLVLGAIHSAGLVIFCCNIYNSSYWPTLSIFIIFVGERPQYKASYDQAGWHRSKNGDAAIEKECTKENFVILLTGVCCYMLISTHELWVVVKEMYICTSQGSKELRETPNRLCCGDKLGVDPRN